MMTLYTNSEYLENTQEGNSYKTYLLNGTGSMKNRYHIISEQFLPQSLKQ